MAKSKQSVELAPNKEVLSNINKKYVYVLALKNDVRGRVFTEDGHLIKDPEYKQRQNLLLRSSIVWDGSDDPFSGKPRKEGKYLIRYYDGCTTLFMDDQPTDPKTVEQLTNSTRELVFVYGHLEVYGYDTMLKTYLDMCSWNIESPYRIQSCAGIFCMLDSEKAAMAEAEQMDQIEIALGYAKDAKESHMRSHCKFLKIADVDLKTMNPLSEKAMRAHYRKEAMRDPANFIKTFNDKTIQIESWIDRAMQSGEISTSLIPNQAVWAKKGVSICDISGIKSKEGIMNKLIEFSQLEEGADFSEQLKMMYE